MLSLGPLYFSNDTRQLLFPLSYLFGTSAFLLAFIEQRLNVFLPSAIILKFRAQTHLQNSKDHVQTMDTHWVANNLHLKEEFFFKFLYFLFILLYNIVSVFPNINTNPHSIGSHTGPSQSLGADGGSGISLAISC